ncbi:FxsA family protein [Conexibacter sp. SYSU D00693]|uniref:FxsA family protein n=1 Tax=Conexibacter sp. SYSU D00693 TaxID=2812560 RepID=UPI00196AB4D6|nr:FxsA family protein [Conexibacter sp. SYSU D00693]
MPLLLVLLFIVVPIAELYVLLQVGQEIGVLPTIALLIADSILGSMLMRSQGRAAWRAFNAAVRAGRPPAREVLDGALVIFGGALLLTPGFLTDVLGLLLLLPPTRAVIRRTLVRSLARRVTFGIGVPPRRPSRGPGGPGAPSDFDVDSTATDLDQRRLP